MEYEPVFISSTEPTPTTQPQTAEATSLSEAFVDPLFENPEAVAAIGLVAVGVALLARHAITRPKSWTSYLRDR